MNKKEDEKSKFKISESNRWDGLTSVRVKSDFETTDLEDSSDFEADSDSDNFNSTASIDHQWKG